MRGGATGSAMGRVLLSILVLSAGLLLLAGCTATAPSTGTPSTPAGLQSKMVHVTGSDHGLVILVEMSTCPHCASTRALLDELGVDYYYIDLNTLTSSEVAEVFSSIHPLCGQGETVPRLVIRGETCIVGDQQDAIREALK
jgi:glutaredoxin-like protein NrdH